MEDISTNNAAEAKKIVIQNMTNIEQAELYRLLQISLDNIYGSG